MTQLNRQITALLLLAGILFFPIFCENKASGIDLPPDTYYYFIQDANGFWSTVVYRLDGAGFVNGVKVIPGLIAGAGGTFLGAIRSIAGIAFADLVRLGAQLASNCWLNGGAPANLIAANAVSAEITAAAAGASTGGAGAAGTAGATTAGGIAGTLGVSTGAVITGVIGAVVVIAVAGGMIYYYNDQASSLNQNSFEISVKMHEQQGTPDPVQAAQIEQSNYDADVSGMNTYCGQSSSRFSPICWAYWGYQGIAN